MLYRVCAHTAKRNFILSIEWQSHGPRGGSITPMEGATQRSSRRAIRSSVAAPLRFLVGIVSWAVKSKKRIRINYNYSGCRLLWSRLIESDAYFDQNSKSRFPPYFNIRNFVPISFYCDDIAPTPVIMIKFYIRRHCLCYVSIYFYQFNLAIVHVTNI